MRRALFSNHISEFSEITINADGAFGRPTWRRLMRALVAILRHCRQRPPPPLFRKNP